MQRSDYIRRCVLQDLEQNGGAFVIHPMLGKSLTVAADGVATEK